jgi:hypothetical protein
VNPFAGPRRYPTRQLTHGPATEKRDPATDVVRRHFHPIPLRRGRSPTEPARALRSLTPGIVEKTLAALAQGEVMELPRRGPLVVRLLLSVQEVIGGSGLQESQTARLYERLADYLSSSEQTADLPRWKEHPDCSLYRVALAGTNRAHVFTFLVLPMIDQGLVTVLACEHETLRTP